MVLRKLAPSILVRLTPSALLLALAMQPLYGEVRTVLVPDFCNLTLAQAKEQTGLPGRPNAMFAAVVPHGPDNGFIVTQSPAPGTPIVPGLSRLLVTTSSVKSSNCSGPPQTPTQPPPNTNDLSRVPNLLGDTPTVATVLVAVARLKPAFEGPQNGLVVQQSPAAGSAVKRGTTVIISLELRDVTVPLLNRMTLAEAAARLQESSLELGPVEGPRGDASFVTGQALPPGSQVPPGTTVGVTLAANAVPPPTPQQVVVPNLIAKTAPAAEADLASLSLESGPVRGPSDGLVSTQTVPPGTLLDIHSPVGFTLQRRQVIVPNVLGDTQAEASSALRAFTLVPKTTDGSAPEPGATLVVATQSPVSGTSVGEHTAVELSLEPPGSIPQPCILACIPIWVWPISLVVVAGVVTVLRRKPLPPPPAPAVCALVPSIPTGRIELDTPAGPALRFAITLHDSLGEPLYQLSIDPDVTLKG